MSQNPFGPTSYPGILPPTVSQDSYVPDQSLNAQYQFPQTPYLQGNGPALLPQPYKQPNLSQEYTQLNGVQPPPGAKQPNPRDNPDFLTEVKNLVGGAFSAVGSVLDAEKKVTAIPIYETLFHPDQVGQAILQYGAGPDHSPGALINLIHEQFENNSDPGLAKFLGELAFDPLTYLGSGEIKAIREGGQILGRTIPGLVDIPGVGEALSQSLRPAEYGMAKWEQMVDAGVSSASNFMAGLANNSVPLTVAKDNARSVLSKVLPGELTEQILNAVPEEYNGVNLGPVSDWINSRSQLGLPRILKIPEFRAIQTAQSYSKGFEAAQQSLSNAGINYGIGADTNSITRAFRNIYAANADSLGDNERAVQGILKSSGPITTSQIKSLNREVGGSISDPSLMDQLAITNAVEQFRQGPSAGGVDEATAVNSLAQLFGADIKGDPEVGGILSRFLNQRSDEARAWINKEIYGKSAQDAIKAIAYRAANNTDANFSLGVAAQRMNNTWTDQLLTAFDSRIYKPLWVNFIQKNINGPLTKFDVMSLGMQFMQPAEAMTRHIIEGGGDRLGITPQQFAQYTSGLENVDPILRQLKPPHYVETGPNTLLHKMLDWNPATAKALDFAEKLDDWSTMFTYTTRMSYWWKMFQNNLADARNAMGIPAREDLKSFWPTTMPPQVANTPELSGMEQGLVDDAWQTALSNPGSSTNIQAVKSGLTVDDVNRKDLSHVLDLPEVWDNLSAGPRGTIRDAIFNQDLNTENINGAIDTAIGQQKKLLTAEPEAMAQIFQGSLDQINKNIASPFFSPADLRQNMSLVNAMQQHAADIPNLVNKAEWDELQGIQGADTWRRNMHTSYSRQLEDALNKVNPILQQGYESLAQGAEKFGLGDDVRNITTLMDNDRRALFQTLLDQNDFQQRFFDARPNRKLDATWNDEATGYYPQKARIWGGYNDSHAAAQLAIRQASDDLSYKIGQAQAAGIIPPPVNTLENAVQQAKSASVEVTPEEIANNPVVPTQAPFTPTSDSIKDLQSPKTKAAWMAQGPDGQPVYFKGYTIDAEGNPQGVGISEVTQAMRDYFGPDAKISIFTPTEKWRGKPENWELNTTSEGANAAAPTNPTEQQFNNIIDTGLTSGLSPEEIAHAINNEIAPSPGNTGTESVISPSSTSEQSQILGAADNATIDAGGNDTAANPNAFGAESSDFLSSKYAALDSFRQRLSDLLQQQINNPRMNDTAYNYLSGKLDNLYTEYSAIPTETKVIMDDASRVAVERTNHMHQQAFTNYDARNNFDKLMLHFIPFWMHESRRWPWLTRTFIGKPSLISAWQAYQDNTDQGYVPLRDAPIIGGMSNLIPGGNSWEVNPFRLISPFNPIQPANQFRPAYFTGGISGAMQNIDQTMAQLGFNFGEMWGIPQDIAEGQPGAELPPFFKSALDFARGSNIPGLSQAAANIQNMLPDNYRDYYTRMILASQGFEPDKVYNGALDGDPTNTATLDIAQQQASLVSGVLAQSGVLRYRTPEWSAYQQARIQAIASMTGLSEFDQNVLKNQGISIQQLKALTPLQREELANIPGARAFNELSEPLLNPAARKLRELQNEFYQTVDDEREETNVAQGKDDTRFQNGLISGVEWRRRYQDRAQNVSTLIDDLKKSPAYKNVPVTSDEQAAARARFNLPPFVQSPEDIILNQYYAIKPTEDPITGDINFSDFFDQRQALLDQHPDLQSVLNDKLARNNTVQVADFRAASALLRPYFAIPDQIAAQHPEIQQALSQLRMLNNTDKVAADQYRSIHPELATLQRMIRQTQQEARRQFPQIDAALVKYYGATPISYQSEARNGSGTSQ